MTMKLQAYTVETVAGMLQCPPSSVYRMIQRGEIRCFKIGERRGLRVPASEVERLLNVAPTATGSETGRLESAAKTMLPNSAELALMRASG